MYFLFEGLKTEITKKWGTKNIFNKKNFMVIIKKMILYIVKMEEKERENFSLFIWLDEIMKKYIYINLLLQYFKIIYRSIID